MNIFSNDINNTKLRFNSRFDLDLKKKWMGYFSRIFSMFLAKTNDNSMFSIDWNNQTLIELIQTDLPNYSPFISPSVSYQLSNRSILNPIKIVQCTRPNRSGNYFCQTMVSENPLQIPIDYLQYIKQKLFSILKKAMQSAHLVNYLVHDDIIAHGGNTNPSLKMKENDWKGAFEPKHNVVNKVIGMFGGSNKQNR